MRIGVCTLLSGAAQLPPGTVDYIEGATGDVLIPTATDAEWEEHKKKIHSLPMPIEALAGFICISDLKTAGPDVDESRLDAFANTVFERASEVGIKTIVFGSGVSRQLPDGFPPEKAFEQFVDHFKRWNESAAQAGVTVALEPLNEEECNFINSVAEGQRIVEAANQSNMRLLADLYHMGRSDEPAENLSKTNGLLAHIHMAEKATRMYPGFERQDFRPYFKELKKANYDGRISMECRYEDFLSDLPKAVEYIREQWEDAK